MTSNIGLLIFARGLQGAGAAVLPIGMAILREELPRDRVDRSVAMLSSTLGIGTALGIPFAAGSCNSPTGTCCSGSPRPSVRA